MKNILALLLLFLLMTISLEANLRHLQFDPRYQPAPPPIICPNGKVFFYNDNEFKYKCK